MPGLLMILCPSLTLKDWAVISAAEPELHGTIISSEFVDFETASTRAYVLTDPFFVLYSANTTGYFCFHSLQRECQELHEG